MRRGVMECTKIILSAYPKLEKVILSIEKCINERCYLSFHDNRDTLSIFSDIADLIERKNKLIGLKRKADKVISLLSEDEIDLLNCKFFNKMPKKPFSFTVRTYFRRQKKLLKKLDEYFSFIGLCDEKFFEDFKNDRFILCCKIKSDDIKRIKCAFNENRTIENPSAKISVDSAVIKNEAFDRMCEKEKRVFAV